LIQCQYRNEATCDLINATLGWRHGCPEHICEECQRVGTSSEDGLEFRRKVAKEWLEFVKKNIHAANDAILKVLVRDHMSPDEVRELTARRDVAWNFTKRGRWAAVSEGWALAHSYMKALTSRGFEGKRVELTIHNKRHVSCTGTTLEGEKVGDSCPALKLSSDGKHHFCGECGCRDRETAWIDREGYPKLSYPHLECPRGMPGFTNQGQVSAPSISFDETDPQNLRLVINQTTGDAPPAPTSVNQQEGNPSSTEPTGAPSPSPVSTGEPTSS